MESVKSTSIPKINTAMGMTKEQYETFSKARLSQKHFDDYLFGCGQWKQNNNEIKFTYGTFRILYQTSYELWLY